MSLDIRQKIQEFVNERPEYLLYEESQILSIMISEGRISKQDVEKAKATSAFGYGFDSITNDYGWSIEKTSEVQVPLRAKETPKPKKGYTKAEYNEAMLFAQQYLFNSATTAHKSIIDYKNGIGYISAGAVWHGFKNIFNIFDNMLGTEGVLTLDEAIKNAEVEKKNAERLASFDKLKSGAFEFTFEKLRGIEFDVKKIQNFKEKSDNYLYAQTSKNQYEILEKGVKELKVLLAREKQLELYGQNNVIANKNQKTFDGRLIEILEEYCGKDEELKNILITEISKDISSKDELQEKFLEVLETLRDNAKAIYEKQLNDKSFEEYHTEYIKSYTETFNGKNPEEEVQAWIMSQEQGTQLIKIAGIIAATTLTGSSNLLANTTNALTKRYGTAVAQQIIKLGLTLEGTGAGLALDYSNALTSKTGLTKERNAEILNNAVHSLPYAIFGAYVSGPFGDRIAKALKGSNSVMPNILQSVVSKSSIGAGFAGEVGLDIVFEAALNNTDFIEIIKSNVQGETQGRFISSLMQMIVGGRAHSAAKTAMKNAGLEGYTIKPLDDGKYEVKSPNGKIYQTTETEFAEIIGKIFEDEIGKIDERNKNEVNEKENNTSDVTGLSYEISRNLNRVKRAIQYVEDKTKASYQGTKRVVKGVSKLINEVSLDNKLKSFGIKNELNREYIIKFLKSTPIESDEIYNGLLNSIKTMKDLQINDNDIQFVLVKISNNNEKFDQSSLDIIAELSILQKKAGNNWNNKTAQHILFNGKNNTEKLEYIKEYNATIDAGYKFDNIESMLMYGIKGVDGRKAYEEILNNEFTQRTKGGLGIEYTAQKYFDICKDSDGKFSYEYWNILQNMDKENVKRPETIFKFLKNDNAEITRANVEIFIAKLKENPAEAYKYNSSIIEKCMTRDGKLDFSRLDLALTITKLGYDFDDSLVKNQDGSYNQNAINMVQKLQSNGFKNKDMNNIFIVAKNHLAIVEGELYSQEIIQKAIELKNSGIKAHNIGNILDDCLEDGKLDINLLENITPIVKDLDYYTITETQWLVPLLKNYNSEMQKQIVPQIQKLMQNGFSIHDIAMCNIFNFKGSYGSIVPEDIINAAIQLKQAGLSWNIKDILTQARFDDGTLNTESLKFLIDLKNKGFIEGDIDDVLAILTTEKGVFLKDNTEIVLSLLKEYKDSEFCNPPKTEKQKENTFEIYSGENRIKSDYVSERGDNIRLVNTLIKMSSDEAGKINLQVLENNKAKLSSLYNKLEPEDKDYFIIYAKLAANKQGSFDENFFNKIHELKYLDDGLLDPSYNQTIKNFLDACKDNNGNLDIQKYNDAVYLVKKHGLSKHQASSCIYLYEEFKPYQNKKFVYDLSITEKRQLQSLLLSYSNNLEGLSKIKNILKTDIIPTTDVDYCMLMKQLSQSLGDTNFVLNKQDLNELNDNIAKLAQTLSSKKPIDTISVNMTYNDLLKRIKNRMSGLSESEKCKIYDYFGFSVKNNEIVGFPNYLGKNIESTDITNSFTKKVVQAVTVEIENFNKNNSITIKDNPELSQVLTSISKLVPEVYNKLSSPEKSAQTLKSLKTITENPTFAKLSDNEQQVLIIAALLKNSNIGTIRETAYCIYNVASKFNMSNKDRQNLYKLISMPDLISEYYNTKINEEGVVYVRFGAPSVKYNKKEVALDMLALEMKDNGLDNLSYLLFSTGDNNLITPELQSALKQRIFEIKSDDFILPQTHTQTIKEHLITQTFKGYKIQVAYASEIPNFYAYVHTPDAGAVNHSSRTTKFSNFEEFKNIDSNAVICTSYISSDKSGTWLDNGFIFDIATGNEYVGMGHDMFSLGKNKKQVVAEYYRNKGLKALSGKGYKYSHRSFISSHLKDILHITENSYSDLNINRRKLKNNLKKLAPDSPEAIKIQNQIAKIDLEIKRINEDYIARIDKVKSQIQSEQINLDEIRTVDPKLASAYEQFLARDNTGHKFGKEALMRKDYWNEVLVSNPKISAIYTKNIDKLPTEYLEKAQKENIPIVIINH